MRLRHDGGAWGNGPDTRSIINQIDRPYPPKFNPLHAIEFRQSAATAGRRLVAPPLHCRQAGTGRNVHTVPPRDEHGCCGRCCHTNDESLPSLPKSVAIDRSDPCFCPVWRQNWLICACRCVNRSAQGPRSAQAWPIPCSSRLRLSLAVLARQKKRCPGGRSLP